MILQLQQNRKSEAKSAECRQQEKGCVSNPIKNGPLHTHRRRSRLPPYEPKAQPPLAFAGGEATSPHIHRQPNHPSSNPPAAQTPLLAPINHWATSRTYQDAAIRRGHEKAHSRHEIDAATLFALWFGMHFAEGNEQEFAENEVELNHHGFGLKAISSLINQCKSKYPGLFCRWSILVGLTRQIC